MRIPKSIILVAVAVACALVSYEMYAQTTNPDTTRKLVLTDALSASLATGPIQSDKTRSLRAVNTTEERVSAAASGSKMTKLTEESVAAVKTVLTKVKQNKPLPKPRARGSVKTAASGSKMTKLTEESGAAVKTVSTKVKQNKPRARGSKAMELMKKVPQSRKDEMIQAIELLYANGLSHQDVVNILRKKMGFLPGEYYFTRNHLRTLDENIFPETKKLALECVKAFKTKKEAFELLLSHRPKLRRRERTYFENCYQELLNEAINKRAYELFDLGLTPGSVSEKVVAERHRQFRLQESYFENIHKRWIEEKEITAMMKIVGPKIELGHSSEKIHADFQLQKDWTPEKKALLANCISLWYQVYDAKMYENLQEWAAAKKSPDEVHGLLKALYPNHADALIDRGVANYHSILNENQQHHG